jgi:putative tricarboxylic transport membrane protein
MNVINQLHHPDRLFAVAMIAAAVIMYGLTGDVAPPDAPGAMSASAYPKFILICIVLLSFLVIIKPVSGETTTRQVSLRGLPIIALCIVYIALLEPVGFFIMTPLFLFTLPVLAGFRNYKLNAISVLVLIALVYGVFVKTLSIPLPAGLLGD